MNRMMKITFLVFAVMFVFTFRLFSATPTISKPSDSDKELRARLDRAMEELASGDEKTVKKAQITLTEIGRPALSELGEKLKVAKHETKKLLEETIESVQWNPALENMKALLKEWGEDNFTEGTFEIIKEPMQGTPEELGDVMKNAFPNCRTFFVKAVFKEEKRPNPDQKYKGRRVLCAPCDETLYDFHSLEDRIKLARKHEIKIENAEAAQAFAEPVNWRKFGSVMDAELKEKGLWRITRSHGSGFICETYALLKLDENGVPVSCEEEEEKKPKD